MGGRHRQPKDLADKLGVKAGQRVRLVGAADAELVGAGHRVAEGEADVVFLAADAPSDLEQIERLRDEIARDGAIWVIRPKGRDDLTEVMVIGAGRAPACTTSRSRASRPRTPV